MGDLTFFLGLQIKQKKDGIFIGQSKYVIDLLNNHNMDQCKSANTPMSAILSLDQDINGKSVNQKTYRGMIGYLIYLQQKLNT